LQDIYNNNNGCIITILFLVRENEEQEEEEKQEEEEEEEEEEDRDVPIENGNNILLYFLIYLSQNIRSIKSFQINNFY